MEYTRMIKLLLPSGNLINLHLGGEDRELKDLISTITEISPHEVKGIKDSKGNYYTISSAIKSINILHNSDDYFELIYTKHYLPSHSKQLSCKMPFEDYYRFDPRHQIILNTTPNVGNYYANYIFEKPVSSIQRTRNKAKIKAVPFASPINFSQKNKNILYLQLLRQLFEEKKINDKVYMYSMSLINSNYEEVINQFELYSKGKIQDSTLIRLLYDYYKKEMYAEEPESVQRKNESIDDQETRELVLISLKDHFDKDDYSILRKMAKYGNEVINCALTDYSNKKNLESLLDSIHFVLNRYKAKMLKWKKPNSSIKLITQSRDNQFVKSKSLVHPSPLIQTSQLMNNQKGKSYLLIKILKCLSFINKIVLEYIQLKHPKELDAIIAYYLQNEKKDALAILLNEQCDSLMKSSILKELSPELVNTIQTLINENNAKVNEIFTVFRKNRFPLAELHVDLQNLVKPHQESTAIRPSLFDLTQQKHNESKRKSAPEGKFKGKAKEKEKEKEQDQIQAFLLDLEALTLPDKEKDQLLEMVKTKNSKLFSVISEYSNGKAPPDLRDKLSKLTSKRNVGTILTKLKSRDSPKKSSQLAKQNPSPMPLSKQNSQAPAFASFEEFLIHLEVENQIDKDKTLYLINLYNEHNEGVHSLWEGYLKSSNNADLAEAILLFLQKKYTGPIPKNSSTSMSLKKDPMRTPENIKNSKNDLICFLKQSERQVESKEKNILDKQQEIISLLFKERCIEKKTFDVISEKIKQEDQCLISTFEVYAVTRDHNEFIETLQLISELSENYKGIFLSMLYKSNLDETEREILKVLYDQKQEMLFSSLELYTECKDNEELFDTFKTLCKKNKDIL